jgi:hypothetical protein
LPRLEKKKKHTYLVGAANEPVATLKTKVARSKAALGEDIDI